LKLIIYTSGYVTGAIDSLAAVHRTAVGNLLLVLSKISIILVKNLVG